MCSSPYCIKQLETGGKQQISIPNATIREIHLFSSNQSTADYSEATPASIGSLPYSTKGISIASYLHYLTNKSWQLRKNTQNMPFNAILHVVRYSESDPIFIFILILILQMAHTQVWSPTHNLLTHPRTNI